MGDPVDKIEGVQKVYENLLVLRCQAGDAAAFGELIERYDRRLRFFLRKMLGSRSGPRGAEADDLIQDVWLAVVRGIGRLADGGALAAWLYRIARDAAFRELRKRRVVTQEWTAAVEAAAVEAEGEIAGAEDPAEFTEEDVAAVYDAIDRLPPEQREVLLLRFLEGMDYAQIAAAVGCSVGTVRSRLHYAKARVRALLGVAARDNAPAGAGKLERKEGKL